MDPTTEQLAAFVGPRTAYYLAAWAPLRSGEAVLGRYNVSGFLFGTGWLLYRKLYRQAAVLCVILVVESGISDSIFQSRGYEAAPPSYNFLMMLIYGSVVGTFGNLWYYRAAQRAVQRAPTEPERSLAEIGRRGGTSLRSVVTGLLLFLLLVLLSALLTPS